MTKKKMILNDIDVAIQEEKDTLKGYGVDE